MPIYDPRENNGPVLPALILANIFPLVGILYDEVSFFALFYLYWWETVIISIFRWLKMSWAEKPSEPDPGYTINGKTLSPEHVNNRGKMRRHYFFMRTGIMMFYLVFIIVFVGVVSTMSEDSVEFARSITFAEPWVFWCFVSYTVLHLIEYITWIRSGTYKETSLVELATPFDGRLITMHVVIVLGTFLAMYTSETLFPNHPRAGSIGYGALFVAIKTGVDIYAYRKNKSRHTVIDAMMPGKSKTDAGGQAGTR